MLEKPGSALVIVGHGSTLNPDSSDPSFQHADAIRERGVFNEVVCCFWKEEPSMREVYYMLESDDVYVVPNFISEGYFTRTVIPRELRLDGRVSHVDGKQVKYCDPVGSHARMTEVLLSRAREVAPGVSPAQTSLLIAGHGTGLNDNSAKAAKDQVRRIAELGEYGEVLAVYMEEPPLVADWAKLTSFPNVIVVPFFIADGLHSYQDIPVLLGFEGEGNKPASERQVFRSNPHFLHGRNLYYAAAIGTEPLIADVMIDLVGQFDTESSRETVLATA